MTMFTVVFAFFICTEIDHIIGLFAIWILLGQPCLLSHFRGKIVNIPCEYLEARPAPIAVQPFGSSSHGPHGVRVAPAIAARARRACLLASDTDRRHQNE